MQAFVDVGGEGGFIESMKGLVHCGAIDAGEGGAPVMVVL